MGAIRQYFPMGNGVESGTQGSQTTVGDFGVIWSFWRKFQARQPGCSVDE
jgi:hypothetical protein